MCITSSDISICGIKQYILYIEAINQMKQHIHPSFYTRKNTPNYLQNDKSIIKKFWYQQQWKLENKRIF